MTFVSCPKLRRDVRGRRGDLRVRGDVAVEGADWHSEELRGARAVAVSLLQGGEDHSGFGGFEALARSVARGEGKIERGRRSRGVGHAACCSRARAVECRAWQVVRRGRRSSR